MRSESRACAAGLVLALLGCGPAVATTGEDERGTTSDSTTAAETAGTTSGSTTPAPPATVSPTSPSSTDGSPSSDTGSGPSTGSSDESTGPLPPFPGEPDVQINLSCNVWDPECPELEKCIAWSNDQSGLWNDARCTAVGPRDVGDACSVQGEPTAGIDNCDSGAMCWGVDADTNDGHCAAQCVGTENAPVCNDPTTSCVVGNEGSINICAQTCDPTSPNCPEDEACYGDLNNGNTVCLRPGTPLVSGPDLLFPAMCPPGSTAVAPELDVNCEDGEPCCVLWCDLSSVPQTCPGAVDCHPWVEEGMGIGTDDRGICLDVPDGR